MKKAETVEFLDPDGSYALVRPLDETRGRVVFSNVLEQGELLYKDPRLTWKEAGEDAGGHTRLGPSDFPPASPEKGDLDAEDFHGREEDRILFEILEGSRKPKSPSRSHRPCARVLYPEGAGDPPDLLMHLVVHYLKMTEGHDDGRWGSLCGCSGLRLRALGSAQVLQSALTASLLERNLPTLEEIVSLFRALVAQEVGAD